jgi:hypothetical protein
MGDPSAHMMEAFGMGVGSPRIECICGRSHCCPDSNCIDEDESKEMREAAAAHPKKYVLYEGYDTVSAKDIGGATVVPDCECQYMVKLERLLWSERRNILAYYKSRRDADAQELRDLDCGLASSGEAKP